MVMQMPLTQSSCVLRTCVHMWGSAYRKTTLLTPLTVRACSEGFLGIPTRSLTTAHVVLKKFPNEICECNVNRSMLLNVHGTPRFYSSSSAKPKPKSSGDRALQEAPESRGGAVTLSTAEKVKENVKTASYGGIIVVGVAIGGAMLYYVLNELFSSESPNNIYSHAFKMCKLSTEVQDALGTPIKCYGEETRRGWRRHVACQQFLAGEKKILRMRFYIEGTFKKGTVNVEKITNDRGKYEYTYISVDVDGYPPRRIEVPF